MLSDLNKRRLVWGAQLEKQKIKVIGWPNVVPYPNNGITELKMDALEHLAQHLHAIHFERTEGPSLKDDMIQIYWWIYRQIDTVAHSSIHSTIVDTHR